MEGTAGAREPRASAVLSAAVGSRSGALQCALGTIVLGRGRQSPRQKRAPPMISLALFKNADRDIPSLRKPGPITPNRNRRNLVKA